MRGLVWDCDDKEKRDGRLAERQDIVVTGGNGWSESFRGRQTMTAHVSRIGEKIGRLSRESTSRCSQSGKIKNVDCCGEGAKQDGLVEGVRGRRFSCDSGGA